MLSDKDGFIWMDGQLVDWRKANVHVLTHTLHYGSGVFEGERAYNGKIFKMREHHERLHASAGYMGFIIPFSVDQMNDAAMAVLEANKLKDAYVRPIAWHGSEALGVSTSHNTVHLAFAAWEWGSYYQNAAGLRLMWSDWVRPAPNMALVHAKANGQYITGSLGMNKAQKLGYNDAVMLDYKGNVAECTSSNIFFVKDGALYTPIPECALNGITRQTILELAKANGIPTQEKNIKPEELLAADEVFITGTAAEVQPVGSIMETTFEIGPITKKLAAIYAELVRRG